MKRNPGPDTFEQIIYMRSFCILLICFFVFHTAKTQTGTGWNWGAISGLATNGPGRKAIDIASDANGNTYATGRFMGTMTIGGFSINTSGDGTSSGNYDEDAFIVKWDANGSVQWLKRYGTAAVASNQVGQVITTDANSNVYVGIGNGYPSVVKYDADGNLLWTKTLTQFEIQAINIGPDGNPIVVTSNAGAKDIFKLDSNTGNILWTVNNIGIGSNSTTTYKDFVDQAGNVYYTAFITGAGTVSIAGQTYSPARLTSYVVSLDNSGSLRWVQAIDNVQVQLGYTTDKYGHSYIQPSGGGGGSFQGVSTASSGGNRYLELDNNGTLVRYAIASPYKGAFRVKDDGVYGFYYEQGGFAFTVTYGNNYFFLPANNTVGMGIVIKYDKTDDHVIWANDIEIDGASFNSGKLSCINIGPGSKVQVGGWFGTAIKYGGTTNTTTIGGGSNQTDFFVAQFDGANVQPSPTTTWTGAADNNWSNSANWSNGAPFGAENTIIPTGAPRYPTGITNANRTTKLTIQNGVTISLPSDFTSPVGIVNNGIIEVTGTGTFQGFNTSQIAPLSGSGRLLFTANSPTSIFYDLTTNGLEYNRVGGTLLSYGGTIGGGLYLTNGILQAGGTITLTDPNAVVTSTSTAFVTGSLKRVVNSNGNYIFPVGAGSNAQTVNLNLKNIAGPQNITVSFSANSTGTVNTTASGVPVTAALNKGYWTITPNASLTNGSYTVTLKESGATNTVTDATRYVVIKRPNSASAWAFNGTNGSASQASGVVTAVAGNLNSFSDFAIGIASSSVNAILPLHFISFTAAVEEEKNVKLRWTTSDEINTDHFEIQHSVDGRSWSGIGSIASMQGTGLNNYSYLHSDVSDGWHYYRLKQTDLDGSFSYSAIASIKLNRGLAAIYPNPIQGNVINIHLDAASANSTYQVVDSKGAVVGRGTIKGIQATIDASTLGSGNYWILLSNGQALPFTK